MPKCEDCRYWKHGPAYVGSCNLLAEREKVALYIIDFDDWCGEYKAKEREER